MIFNPEIFKAYDIRGLYSTDFDEDFAFQLGMTLVKYLRARKLVVARDLRDSSLALADSFKAGIKSMGCDVLDLGPITTPLFYFAIKESGADGGAVVTASHNPPEYNGFKIYRYEAIPIGSNSGLIDLQRILSDSVFEKPKYAGEELADDSITSKYTDLMVKKSGLKPGTTKLAVKISAEDLVRKELEKILYKLEIRPVNDREDIGFKFDFDGDRLMVFDQSGQKIRGDLIAGVLGSKLTGRFWRKPRLVHDARFSRGVLDHMRTRGIKIIRSRVGHTFIKDAMRKFGADLGGELSGHLYFKEVGYVESAILAMLKIMKILNESDQSITKLTEPMMTWFNSGEISCPKENKLEIGPTSERLKEKYKEGKVDELDGVTVAYEDWWFNLRPSNTEPVLRLTVEAKTKKLLDEKLVEVRGLL